MHFPILIEVRRPIFLPIVFAAVSALALVALGFSHLTLWAKGLCLLLWGLFLGSAFGWFKSHSKAVLRTGFTLKPVCHALYLASPHRLEIVIQENTPEERLEATCLAYAKLPFCLFLRLQIADEPSAFSLLLGSDQIGKEDLRKLTVWCRTQSVKDL